jgi:hypothetical protein
MLSGGFSNLAYYLEAYGFMDFLLPMMLVFTIIYAVLSRTKLLGDRKQFHVMVALILSLLFVVPHIMGYYPLGYDPVQVMNETLPSISLVAVAAIMLLTLMGIFGTNFSAAAAPVIAIAAIAFVAYIFGSSLGLWTAPYDVFYWWTPEVTELIIILLVFGLVVWVIVREPETTNSPGGRLFSNIGKLFERK